MEQIEWQEGIPGGVRCASEVLGAQFASALNGTPVTVHMPGPPVTGAALPLTQPTAILATFDLVMEGWGVRPPGGTSTVLVNRLGFTATVPDPQIVGDEMNDWSVLFLSWLDVLTGQHLTPVGFRPPQHAQNRTCLMVRDDDSLHHTAVVRGFPKVNALTHLDASSEMLEHCCSLAGAKEPVPLAWMLLRDARALYRVDQTRRAAIECGSAAEMAINHLLDRRGVSIPQRQRTLGWTSRFLKRDGYPLVSDFDTTFLPIRNRVVHMNPGGDTVSETEALRMLEIAADLVEDAFTLPHGLKRQW